MCFLIWRHCGRIVTPMKKNVLKKCIALILAASVFAGCGSSVATEISPIVEIDDSVVSMLDAPDIAYEKEKMLPSIMTDALGYDCYAEKLAIIEAPILPGEFTVHNKDTGEVVKRSKLKVREATEDGELYTANADFSDVTEPGVYYIEADLIGRSNDFFIKEGCYDEILLTYFEKFRSLRDKTDTEVTVPFEDNAEATLEVSGGWITGDDGRKDVCEGCLAVQDILTGVEYFPNDFGDDWNSPDSGNKIPDIVDEAMFEATWLLKMQNPETGGVYTAVAPKTNEQGTAEGFVVMGETTRATAYYCATMARLSYMIKKYDPKFSSKCIEAANLSWKCLEKNKELVDPAQMFRAAVEMYRAVGYAAYGSVIDKYLKENADKDYEERIVLDGAMVYMSSTRATNVDHCMRLMEHFMSRTEDKSNASRASRYLVEPGEIDLNGLIRNVFELSVVDYIISNREYKMIEENYLHYFCGRNPESVVYCDMVNTPDAYAELLVVLAKTAARHR